MRFDVLTIFPGVFDSFLGESLMSKAIEKGIIDIRIHDIRSYCSDAHAQVDDRPFGGGPGMVLKVEPIYKALKDIEALPNQRNTDTEHVYLLSPRGEQYTQDVARRMSLLDRVVLIAGRYEGVDARVEEFVDGLLSIGPYILSGGEIPSMSVIESVSRLLPGYMRNFESIMKSTKDKISDVESEYPVYTRPEIFVADSGDKYAVPKVLLSGNHSKIKKWRNEHTV